MWETWWDIVRALNIFLAAVGIFLNETKAVRLKFVHTFAVDAMVGYITVMSWCVCYMTSATLMWLYDVDAGPWTAVITIPLLLTVVTGLMGRRPKDSADASKEGK